MFNIGDLVCYPMHGIGRIQSITENVCDDKTVSYYVIEFLASNMTAMVPVSKASEIGLRHLIKPEEYEGVIEFMGSDFVRDENDNWNQRYRENMERLKRGSILEIADVVKCLERRDSERGLSSVERKMLLTAKKVLVMELAIVSGKTEDEIELIV
ncbi:MAG: CarD family transcriptional regulator [Clostridia bacterium]|nr:CarD family transcriptional regulator [Clostridia bacterium]